MKNNSRNIRFKNDDYAEEEHIRISLYDLIEAISDEVRPGEDNLIPETIQHLFDSGQARFADCHTEICGGVQ